MDLALFSNLFSKLRIPVIVCRNEADYPVVYMNVRAGLLFSPTHTTSALTGEKALGGLFSLLRFVSPGERDIFMQMAEKAGQVDRYESEFYSFDDKKLTFTLSGNRISLEAPGDYFVLFLVEGSDGAAEVNAYESYLTSIIQASFVADDVDKAVGKVLSMAGEFVNVDRSYIFEEVSPTMTRNTYEWCAPGVEPAIRGLQNLKKEDYNYDAIVEGGMYITDDVRELPGEDRAILEAQGIKSLAIIPFYEKEHPLGYVGFDDTTRYRKWSHEEINFLHGISEILAMLVYRRKTEQEALGSREILQLLFDNSEEIIYVSRLDDYTLVFVSRALAESLGSTREELLGRVCWQTLQTGQSGPCSFCPIPHIKLKPGQDRSDVYVWEHQNTVTGKTYIAKDIIIKWVDGDLVHLETATDISMRTEYEEELRRTASVDSMTGAYNRMWGTRVLEERLPRGGPGQSLCFIDIDGLKKTNDTHGHAAGDGMLTTTVDIIQRHLTGRDFLCRWGGDEFLMLLELPPEEAAARIGEMQAEMGRFNEAGDKPFLLSFSFGIVPFNPIAGAFDALVTEADAEMYKNKMAKRGLLRRKDDRT